MKKLSLFALGLTLGLCVYAQDGPKSDLFFGYSFLRVNSDQRIPAFSAQGGLTNFAWNFGNHLAGEAEFAGYHNGNINNFHFDTTTYSYVFGPRLSWGRTRVVDPWVHALFGVNQTTSSIAANSLLIPTPLAGSIVGSNLKSNGRYEQSQANFAMAIGGGLDIKLSKRILLRPIQLDYYLTRFETKDLENLVNGTTSNKNQNNLRFATGVAFNFGGAQ
jgi:opacity protein-like surface antigen